ncbi:MAG: 2-oxo acid dehydrogenase subunit E2 [Candidatus Marinimicrobia bacterium]|nr:2-oxo acid dehydrogenase subunit E2 [Candidatus Neomarinimicrobiota bacterium]
MTEKTTSPWRKLSIAIYGAPLEGKVYGTYEVDVTDMMTYIQKRKEEGVRLTVTQFVVAALGQALYYDAPEVNCYVRRGKIVYRDSADVFISVLKKSGNGQTGMVVKDSQNKTVTEIAESIDSRLEAKREGKEKGFFSLVSTLAKIPWPFRKMALKIITWWIFDMEFPVPGLKKQTSPFGSIMLTNIGTFGLKTGMVALFPIGKLPGVITMGRAEETAVVIDGEIQVRTMLPFTGTFDHRMVDGAQIGKLARAMQQRLKHPELLDRKKENQ